MSPLLPAATLNAMLDGFARLGLDRRQLVAALGAPFSATRAPGVMVDGRLFGLLWAAAGRQRDDPALATALGLAIPYGAFGIADYLVGSSHTLGGGLESLAQHQKLVASGFTLELDRADGMCWVRLCSQEVQEPPYRASEMTVAILVARFREGTDGRFEPAFVCLRDDMPRAGAIHERLLGVPVRYAAPAAAVVFPDSQWSLRLRGEDRYLKELLAQTADQLGVSPEDTRTVSVAVRARLRAALADGRCDAPHMARLLGMSVRTMQRALREERCAFTSLVDEFRRAEALRLASDPGIALVTIASRLGYDEQTSLSRAFRRWTGQSPRQWRFARMVEFADSHRHVARART